MRKELLIFGLILAVVLIYVFFLTSLVRMGKQGRLERQRQDSVRCATVMPMARTGQDSIRILLVLPACTTNMHK